MKTKRTLFTTALNTARTALNVASGVFSELTVADGEITKRYRLSPYGTFPADDVSGQPILQVVDREAGETMAANFASLSSKIATFFRGVPIYEGHADDPGWSEKNPGHRASAVGRIKSIETEDDGIYVTAVLNSDGVALLSGDAPKYTGHSPLWRLAAVPGQPKHFRPVLLWSDALTNTPNIMANTIALNALTGLADEYPTDETDPSPDAEATADADETEKPTQDMKLTPAALAALGFAEDAEPTADEISAAIVTMLSEKAAAEAEKATAEETATAANSRATRLESELQTVLGTAVDTVITDAINTGRITEAEKPAWTQALNTSFGSESAKLSKLMPTLNTELKIDLGQRRNAEITDAANAAGKITEGVRSFAAEKGIDISTSSGWTRAYDQCRAAQPALFAK